MTEYTTESPASLERRQRRRRAVITIGVLVLGLFFAFWYGLSYYEADRQRVAARPPQPTCRPFDPSVLSPGDVTVNVYNATTRSGLAGRTAKAFEERGFTVDAVDNDPTDRATPKVAEIRYGAGGRNAASVVLRVMPKGTKGVAVSRADATVDVALGAGFRTLLPLPVETGLPMCPAPSASAS